MSYEPGVNLIGFLKGEIGLGEGSRLLARSVIEAGIPLLAYNLEIPGAMRYGDTSLDKYLTTNLPYFVNIIHLNPPEVEYVYDTREKGWFEGRYTIGFFLWELERLPENWLKPFRLINEIWTPSEYTSAVFRSVTDKPVFTMPYPITAVADRRFDREYFGLNKDSVLFLCMFDTNSTIERKNPAAAIRAYRMAFGSGNNKTGLVVKVNNPGGEAMERIAAEISGLNNVRVITGSLPKAASDALTDCCDVFISLHRAEGFGLPLAEAMYLGKPVIATNWSANREFMKDGTFCPVGYELVPVPEGIRHYSGLGRWAEPDLTQAAAYMRLLAEDRRFRIRLGKAAAKHVKTAHTLQIAAGRAGKRIKEIYQAN